MMVKDSVTVNFGDTKTDCDFTPYVEVKTSPCQSNDTVLIKLFAKKMVDFTNLKIYYGSNPLSGGNVKFLNDVETEGTVFEDSYSGKTKKPINVINSVIATSEIVTFSNNTFLNVYNAGVNIPCLITGDICFQATNTKKLFGSVDITYQYKMYQKEYRWIAPFVTNNTSYPFYVLYNNKKLQTFHIEVQPSSIKKDITIVIKNVANDATIPGASIVINGGGKVFYGTSDINGKCDFTLFTNINYNVEVSASGYIDTDKDYLNNDSFVIT